MPCLGEVGGPDPRGEKMPPKKIKLAEGQTRTKSFFRRSTSTYESSMESDYPESSSSETGETTRSSSTTASIADSSDAMESGTSERSTSRVRRGVASQLRGDHLESRNGKHFIRGCYFRRMVLTVSTVVILGVKLRVMQVYLQLSHTQETDQTNLDDMKQARLTTKTKRLTKSSRFEVQHILLCWI